MDGCYLNTVFPLDQTSAQEYQLKMMDPGFCMQYVAYV